MSAEPKSEAGAVAIAERRDGLGQFCFHHHLVVMAYILLGWLVPMKAALVAYLVFVPSVALQWRLNQNSCLLNNLESLLRTGRWRDPNNREEGAWLVTLAREKLGLPVTAAQVDIFTYSLLALLWTLALLHLGGW